MQDLSSLIQSLPQENESAHLEANKRITQSIVTLKKTSYIHTLDKPINSQEVRKCIVALKNGKAYGLDLISNEMLKTAGPLIEDLLIKLFNNCLESGVYPKTWCKGYMTPVFKIGDR